MIDILSTISTIAWAIGALTVAVAVILGIFPLLWKLGIGRWQTKIAIISNDTNSKESVKDDLVSSRLFRQKNIVPLCSQDIQKLDKYSIIIACDDMIESLKMILDKKQSSSGLIVYATKTKLTAGQMDLLNRHPLVTLTNFRGRLMNDLIPLLMSTAYVKRQH